MNVKLENVRKETFPRVMHCLGRMKTIDGMLDKNAFTCGGAERDRGGDGGRGGFRGRGGGGFQRITHTSNVVNNKEEWVATRMAAGVDWRLPRQCECTALRLVKILQ
eukprot:1117639_1